MTKIIRIKDESLWKKVGVICAIFFPDISVTEHLILTELVCNNAASGINMAGDVSKQIREKLEIPEGSFNTYIYRLNQKKAITKKGSIVYVHPALNELIEQDSILIRFKNDVPADHVTS